MSGPQLELYVCILFIKKWLGIPARGVTDVAIFHPYMLNVKQPSALYEEDHAGNHTSMKLKGDIVLKAALGSQVKRESQSIRKSSTAVTCDQMFATCVENNQPVACEVCGKTFKIQKNLKSHMMIHNTTKD